ncbi:MAG: hypothetical protein KIS65_04570 [Nitrosomonas sp.]|nr:hypothetical protein [Nitrosomonas sp.]MCW5618471.1 hypothetical protein [Nitrosomonas sp.]
MLVLCPLRAQAFIALSMICACYWLANGSVFTPILHIRLAFIFSSGHPEKNRENTG